MNVASRPRRHAAALKSEQGRINFAFSESYFSNFIECTENLMCAFESVLLQLRARYADQMQERPEVEPVEFKTQDNRAGITEFVLPIKAAEQKTAINKMLPYLRKRSLRRRASLRQGQIG